MSFFVLSYLAFLGLATDLPGPSSDIQCGEIATTEVEARKSAFEVTRLDADGLDDYVIETDSYYGGWPLHVVQLVYRENDRVIIDTWIKKFDMSDTKAAVSLVLDPSIISNIELVFLYLEPDVYCPKDVRVKFRLPAGNQRTE